MSWFSSIFKWPEDHPAAKVAAIPVLDIKANISEPVISFVKTFKANPKRFKLFYKTPNEWKACGFMFEWTVEQPISMKLVDTKENLEWTFCYWPTRNYGLKINDYPIFLTFEEAGYIYQKVLQYNDDRLENFTKCRHRKEFRKAMKEREALKKVYCK